MIDIKNFKPLHENVLVKRDEPEPENDGILIPESWRTRGLRGTIIQIGEEVVTGLKIGDVVLCSEIGLPFKEAREYGIVPYDNILAILKVQDNIERIYPIKRNVLIEAVYKPEESIIKVRKQNIVTGKIYRTRFFSELQANQEVLFDVKDSIICSESDGIYHILDESKIICVINN